MALVFKQDAINGILYYQYMEGLAPEKAYEKICKTVGYETMTLEEFKEQFRRIEGKEYSLTEGPPNQSPITLAHLFGNSVISPHIFKHFDLTDRLILRKVSHFYKDCVKNNPFKIDNFVSTGGFNEIKADQFQVTYERTRKGVLIVHEGKTKFAELGDWVATKNDTKAILDNRNLTIDHLQTNFDWDFFERSLPRFDDKVRLKVRKMTIKADKIHEVRYALSIIHPKTIEELWINCDEKYSVFYIDVIALWKVQWKELKVLMSQMRFGTGNFVQFFGHFDYICFVVQNTRISLAVLEHLKDTLLLRQTVQKFEIIPSFDHCSKDPLFIIPPRSFRPFQDPTNPDKFIFPYPNSEEVLTFEISYNSVFFKGPAYSTAHQLLGEQPRIGPAENVVEEEWMYANEPYEYKMY